MEKSDWGGPGTSLFWANQWQAHINEDKIPFQQSDPNEQVQYWTIVFLLWLAKGYHLGGSSHYKWDFVMRDHHRDRQRQKIEENQQEKIGTTGTKFLFACMYILCVYNYIYCVLYANSVYMIYPQELIWHDIGTIKKVLPRPAQLLAQLPAESAGDGAWGLGEMGKLRGKGVNVGCQQIWTMYVCLYVWMYECMNVCMYEWMYVWMYVCMYECILASIYFTHHGLLFLRGFSCWSAPLFADALPLALRVQGQPCDVHTSKQQLSPPLFDWVESYQIQIFFEGATDVRGSYRC